jgi:hypothetical protein
VKFTNFRVAHSTLYVGFFVQARVLNAGDDWRARNRIMKKIFNEEERNLKSIHSYCVVPLHSKVFLRY